MMCNRFVSFIWQIAPYLLNVVEIRTFWRSSGFLISYVAASFYENIQTLCSALSWSIPQALHHDLRTMLLSLSHSCVVGCVLRVMIVLEGEPLSPPEVLFSLRWSLYVDPFGCPSTLTIVPYPSHWKTLTQHARCCYHGVGRWWVLHAFLQTRRFKLRLHNSISALSDQRILFLTVRESFRWFALQTPGGLSCVFHRGEAFVWPLCIRHRHVISSHTSAFSLSSYPLPVLSMSFRGICL